MKVNADSAVVNTIPGTIESSDIESLSHLVVANLPAPSELLQTQFNDYWIQLLNYSLAYSYLSASTGSSLDARRAGINPLITPTSNSTSVETARVISEMCR
jgi:hypothetical protein